MRKKRKNKCPLCGESPPTGPIPEEHAHIPRCPTCGAPLLALFPID